MYKITVHIAPVGNAIAGSDPSKVGHMWFTLDDGSGTADSYGFAPKIEGEAHGGGEVKTNDDDHYINPPYNYEKEISKEQYEAISAMAENAKALANNSEGRWAQYNGLYNSCVDFTYSALNAGGLIDSPEAGFQGNIFPWFNRWDMERDLLGQPSWWDKNIAIPVNDFFRRAKNFIFPKDPLALDLDNDGIETIGVTATTQVLFDFDADGIKTGTGWVKSDDALLVLDKNAKVRAKGSDPFSSTLWLGRCRRKQLPMLRTLSNQGAQHE